jgi:hypothetical protein
LLLVAVATGVTDSLGTDSDDMIQDRFSSSFRTVCDCSYIRTCLSYVPTTERVSWGRNNLCTDHRGPVPCSKHNAVDVYNHRDTTPLGCRVECDGDPVGERKSFRRTRRTTSEFDKESNV